LAVGFFWGPRGISLAAWIWRFVHDEPIEKIISGGSHLLCGFGHNARGDSVVYSEPVSHDVLGARLCRPCWTAAIALPIGYLLRLVKENENAQKEAQNSSGYPTYLITFLVTADDTLYSTNTWAIGPVRFLHATVCIDRGSVLASAYLTKITKSNEIKWEHGPEPLTFSPHNPGDPLPRMMHHGLSYNLDVLVVVASGNEIRVCNDERIWRRWPRLHEIFAEKGDYILSITLAGNGAQSNTVDLTFDWTGNWQTSFLYSPRDQIPNRTTPRSVSYDQETEIIKLLKGVSVRPIWITTKSGNDDETRNYATQLTKVFTKAGVPIQGLASANEGTLFPDGVSLFWQKSNDNDLTASALIDAVRITGVKCREVDRQIGTQPEINLMIGTNEVTPPL
jgi:hypothetical protein